jgi:hypothetical protein
VDGGQRVSHVFINRAELRVSSALVIDSLIFITIIGGFGDHRVVFCSNTLDLHTAGVDDVETHTHKQSLVVSCFAVFKPLHRT